ncbi:exodeoxyribonuclease V subunit beta [uncultured Thiocystis sp.]|jgi:exodeoxyribonuclease V beta subunit|uniref:exodeoxyribonuclease V subunit beta n=1 Tax=uncultured Thiocystis sp. TaxID=1202134 RepID=UPI0025CC8ED1|nr:exodeoxyribonuclease V subunit beta [uncultured Thiocystis sp.]
MSQRLDPLAFPLRGSRLVEASAGTGKTFTLALLYTRLVLGHGGEGMAFDRPLMPPEILVVTFTDAATKELRDRIRQRLVEAAVCFEAAPPHPQPLSPKGEGSNPLHDLRATYAPQDWPGCARRLRLAAEWMDEAMISTIHGWCYRMLQEHAFDTRGLFERELVTDQTDLLAEVTRDYWRVHFYPLPPAQVRCVLDVVKSPDALRDKLATWLQRREAVLSYKGEPLRVDSLDAPLTRQCQWLNAKEGAEAERQRLDAERAVLEQAARDLWRAHRATLETHLRELRPHLNGTTHGSTHAEPFDDLLAEIAAWSEGGAAPTKLKSFVQGAFKFKKTAKVTTEMTHPAFQALADWQAAGAKPSLPEEPEPSFEACLIAHAARWVGRELERRLLVQAEMGFDDLLRQLDAALSPSGAGGGAGDGGHAQRLAETIRRQFPVALIDEFQDTDPVQYRIFDRIYQVAETPEDVALIMIGDPKQAIYGFRGADIHTYLDARRATEGRHYTLGVNYRSTESMVDACNRLFEQAETQARGAFRFKTDTEHPIPYQVVEASGRAERLILDGQAATALTFWTLDIDLESGTDPISPDDYRRRMAEATATRLVIWLQQAREGKAGFASSPSPQPLSPRGEGLVDAVWQPLCPQDIAILVRTGTEAAAMREALAARRIHSVYLSDRESVFQTQEAGDLLHWLRACAAPTDETLVRAALGTNTLAVPLEQLAQLQRDELAWEARIERFRGYRQVWRRQGVLAMLRRLMQDVALPARLLGRGNGERILTNLLHLAEWLQQSATALDGEQALIRHLSEHVGASGDEFIQRLESDAERVRIVTIHKAKGLEYPLVLLPFICSWRAVDGHTRQVPYRAGPRTLLELAPKARFGEAWAAADDARLSEDMRLLYVAVTRARHALWLGIAPLKSGNAKKSQLEKSAIGHVLNGGKPFETPADILEALARLRGDCASMRIESAPSPSITRLAPASAVALEPARRAPKTRPPSWWIASYSSLRIVAWEASGSEEAASALPSDQAQGFELVPSVETAVQETTLEETKRSIRSDDADDVGLARTAKPEKDSHLHALPRGSRQGTFLHGILEWAANQRARDDRGQILRGYAATAKARTLRLEMLGQRCNLRGLTDWIAPLDAWLEDFLVRPWVLDGLPDAAGQPPTLALCDLAPERIQVEMEFWLESRAVQTRTLDRLVQTHCLAGHSRPGIGADRLNGMLKGFIDLVFEHQGRYYVADWKSNWLGSDDAAYTPEAMREAILNARYDLQYVLYLLALHRQLRARLPDYDYDRHVGGAVYVFLRGGYSASQGFFMDKPPRILIETLDRLFAGETTAGREVA